MSLAEAAMKEQAKQKAEWQRKFDENPVAKMLKEAAEKKGYFEFAWDTWECANYETEFYVNMADLVWETITQ